MLRFFYSISLIIFPSNGENLKPWPEQHEHTNMRSSYGSVQSITNYSDFVPV